MTSDGGGEQRGKRRRPTAGQVARAAGVSQPTVSRALRDDSAIAQATKDRVRAIAKELGYDPEHTRTMRAPRVPTVMAGRPTSFDIAAIAGVAQSTVSRALQNDPSIRESTRNRIRAIADQLNYTVDRNASLLRTKQTRTIAVQFFEDQLPNGEINPFFLSLLSALLRSCAERGYDLLTSFQKPAGSKLENAVRADGIILLGYGDYELYKERLRSFDAVGARYVRWGASDPANKGPTVGYDNLAGGRIAGEFLLEQGRRNIVFVGRADAAYPEFLDRYRGCVEAMEAHGLPRNSCYQVDALSVEKDGYDAVERIYASGRPVDAIFAASDLIGLGVIRGLLERGVVIPDDVALIGFDDIPAAATTNPPLTTVAQDFAAAGELLVDTIVKIVAGEVVKDMTLLPRLVRRATA